MEKELPTPAVTVIIATYNRSNVVSFAIRSVLAQTFQDWELWVMGDCCTDDTEAVVASFQDPRIHFLNLPKNYGNQYGPNNEGMERARGRYIAFLNHDDLWLPEHLQVAVDGLQSTGADLIFPLMGVVDPGGRGRLSNRVPRGFFRPDFFIPASSWVFRRELAGELGPWRSPSEMFNIPSQEWLYRAWKAKRVLRLIPTLTAVSFPTGARRGVYARRESRENREFLEKILADAGFREKELTRLSSSSNMHSFYNFKWKGIQLCKRIPFWFGIHPLSFWNFLVSPRKGGVIRKLQKFRGLVGHED